MKLISMPIIKIKAFDTEIVNIYELLIEHFNNNLAIQFENGLNKKVFFVYNEKETGTFHSTRWRRDYNLVIFHLKRYMHCNRKIVSKFPKSQHRPFLLRVLVRLFSKLKWNFNWINFHVDLD